MKWIRTTGLGCFITILLIFISSCDGKGSDSAVPELDAPTAIALPGSTATINGTTPIVIAFSDTMDTTTLDLKGSMAAESNGGSWSDNTNVNDTLTISPTTSWSDGAHTLIFNANNILTASLSTVTLNYTVDSTLPVASILPTDGNTIVGNEFVVITFDETIDITSVVASGSVWNQGDGGVWSSTNYPDDTLTLGPKNLWSEGPVNLTLGVIDLAGNAVTLNLSYTVAAASCGDSILNQDETDVDCGGSICSACADGDNCNVNSDCNSITCDLGVCAACLDTDTDGVCDAVDLCPLDDPDDTDTDGSCDSDDCAPLDTSVYPGAVEVCNGVDDDCDGESDEGLNDPYSYTCATTNGSGTCPGILTCSAATGYTCDPRTPTGDPTVCGVGACLREASTECDGAPFTCVPGTPGPEEICGNSIDEDCDGSLTNGC